jgi:hypothetical protein
VSKSLGAEKMRFYLEEAAFDIAELLRPEIEPPKAKL